MKIGVALPAYNALPHIERCLTTLRAQTYPVGIYITDDCSTDGMTKFLRDRPDWYTECAVAKERKGWPTALNIAAQQAIDDGCEAIFVMNADDFLRIDCIEKCAYAITGNDFVNIYAQEIGGNNAVRAILKDDAQLKDLFGDACPLGIGLIRTHVWEAVRGYSTDISLPGSFGFSEDWDFWIKVFEAGYSQYAVIHEPLYYYVIHDGQLHREGLAHHAEARKLIMEKHHAERL